MQVLRDRRTHEGKVITELQRQRDLYLSYLKGNVTVDEAQEASPGGNRKDGVSIDQLNRKSTLRRKLPKNAVTRATIH